MDEITFILINDNMDYIGWSKAPEKPEDKPGLTWYPRKGENPIRLDDFLFKWENNELILKSQSELDVMQAAIDKQKDIDLKQDKVVEKLAEAVNNILRYIENKNTLTAGEQLFVDNFCNDYDAWINAKE